MTGLSKNESCDMTSLFWGNHTAVFSFCIQVFSRKVTLTD